MTDPKPKQIADNPQAVSQGKPGEKKDIQVSEVILNKPHLRNWK
jgi:hypothetical protein